jgi:serine/threonine-protein kinase
MARIYYASLDGPAGFVKPCVIKKVLPEYAQLPDFQRMFSDEARVAALLSHPNIVQAFDFGEVRGEYFLALEWVDGAPLAAMMKRAAEMRTWFDPGAALHVVVSLCDALGYAHSATAAGGQPLGVIHRDVTPGNILISKRGAVKLTDFGVVKSAVNQALSKPATLKGKIPYMSPEQARCESVYQRSDIYSLGILLYELTTGQRLFRRSSMTESLRAVSDGEVTLPSGFMRYPSELEAILRRALAKRREERYPTARMMQEDLERYRTANGIPPGAVSLAGLLEALFPEGMPTAPPRAGRG